MIVVIISDTFPSCANIINAYTNAEFFEYHDKLLRNFYFKEKNICALLDPNNQSII